MVVVDAAGWIAERAGVPDGRIQPGLERVDGGGGVTGLVVLDHRRGGPGSTGEADVVVSLIGLIQVLLCELGLIDVVLLAAAPTETAPEEPTNDGDAGEAAEQDLQEQAACSGVDVQEDWARSARQDSSGAARPAQCVRVIVGFTVAGLRWGSPRGVFDPPGSCRRGLWGDGGG